MRSDSDSRARAVRGCRLSLTRSQSPLRRVGQTYKLLPVFRRPPGFGHRFDLASFASLSPVAARDRTSRRTHSGPPGSMRSMMVALLSLETISAFVVQPATQLLGSSLPLARGAAMQMQMPLESAATALTSLPSTLLADSSPLDFLVGFDTNPLILLVPMGAGSLVAALIIFILVKSAG